MLSKIGILLLMSVGLLFANQSDPNYITDFGIYVYGDVQSIQNAFILVEAIANSDTVHKYILPLISLYAISTSAYKWSKEGITRNFFLNIGFTGAGIIFLAASSLPTTVHIEDLRAETNLAGLPQKTYAKVEHIPYPIAFVTSTVSTITDSLKTVYEDAIELVNNANGIGDIKGASYTNLGFGGAIGDILKVGRLANFSTGDSESVRFSRALSAYTEECVLKQAVTQNPSLLGLVKNPKMDIFKQISPTNMAITGDGYSITFDNNTTSCEDFYNNELANKYSSVSDSLITRINKNTVGDLTSNNVINAYKSMGADINDSFIANDIGKFKAYVMNMAALGPTLNAFRNVGVNLNSGQDVANSVTANLSLADLQSNGVGQFKWMMEIIPMAFHYMLGVIYSISILIMLFATALGYEKGIMMWRNFAKGLMTFEFIKISLVIITSTVNQFMAFHAADFLASVGQNPATLTSIPYTMHYLATMSGIAGILGITAIFMIPTMVFSGEVAMAAGAIGALAGRYKGNDIDTAMKETSKQKATNAAYEQELADRAAQEHLDYLGIEVPNGMGAAEYYASYKKDIAAANAGYAASRKGVNSLNSMGHAVKGQEIENISSMETLDTHTELEDFNLAGIGKGAQMAGAVQGGASAVNKYGASKIASGTATATASGIANTVGMGEEMDVELGMKTGELGGRAKARGEIGNLKGAKREGIDNYLDGTEFQSAKKGATTGKYGKETDLEHALGSGHFDGTKMGATDNRIADMKNSEGKARTLANQGVDKMDQQATGAQKAQVYGTDGHNAKEHAKFMEGGTELNRKALNEKELAMGAAMHLKSEKDRRQKYADIEAATAGKILDEFSNAKGARKTLNVKGDKDGYIESVDNDKKISWTDTDKKGKKTTHTMSRAKANELLADSGMNQTLGKGAAIDNITDGGKHMTRMAKTAQASEMSSFAELNAAIEAAGGIKPLARFKGTSSAIQTTKAMSATDAELKEHLVKSGAAANQAEAQKILDAHKQGAEEVANKIKSALASMGKYADAQTGGKVRSDIRNIDTLGGGDMEAYKKIVASDAGKKASASLSEFNQDVASGIRDGSSGDMTDKGLEAMDYVAGKKASSMASQKGAAEDFHDALAKLRDKTIENNLKDGKTETEAKEAGKKAIEHYLGKDGKLLNGLALSNRQAELSTRVYAGSNAISVGNGLFGGSTVGGKFAGKLSEGFSTITDDSSTKIVGKTTQFKTEAARNAALAGFREKYLRDPKNDEELLKSIEGTETSKQTISDTIGNTIDGISKFFGMSTPTAATTTAFGATGLLGYGLDKKYNQGKGWKLAKKGGAYLNPFSKKRLNEADKDSNDRHNDETKKPNNNNVHNKTPSTKNYLLDQVHAKQAELKQSFKDGTISSSDYTSKSAELKNLERKIENNKVTSYDLKKSGLKRNDLVFGDKGVVDFEASDKIKTDAAKIRKEKKLNTTKEVLGRDGKGKVKHYNIDNPKDVEEYLKNNHGHGSSLKDGRRVKGKSKTNIKGGGSWRTAIARSLLGAVVIEGVSKANEQLGEWLEKASHLSMPSDMLLSGVPLGGNGADEIPDLNGRSKEWIMMYKKHLENLSRDADTTPSDPSVANAWNALDSINNNKTLSDLKTTNTITAASIDRSLPKAIDTYNTQQNIQALQSGVNNGVTMQSRGGTITFGRSPTTGNMNIKFPDQKYALGTQMPYNQFQSIMDNPAEMQNFANMIAMSNLTPDNGQGLLNSTTFETFKQELGSGIQMVNFQTAMANSNAGAAVELAEETHTIMEDNVMKNLDVLAEQMLDINNKVDDLS